MTFNTGTFLERRYERYERFAGPGTAARLDIGIIVSVTPALVAEVYRSLLDSVEADGRPQLAASMPTLGDERVATRGRTTSTPDLPAERVTAMFRRSAVLVTLEWSGLVDQPNVALVRAVAEQIDARIQE